MPAVSPCDSSPTMSELPERSTYTLSEASLSKASLSTNATADNLPGPGRTIGLAYDFGGRMLETQLGSFVQKYGRGKQKSPSDTPSASSSSTLLDDSDSLLYQSADFASNSSPSTNATASNLPGTGRTFGLAYTVAGRVLERHLSVVGEKLGLGSRAAARRIVKRYDIMKRRQAVSELIGLFGFACGLAEAKKTHLAQVRKDEKEIRRILKYATK